MVRVEADGWGCVPESMWRLEDPLNKDRAYLAKFACADVADRTADGGFALTATGSLWHLPSGGDGGSAEPEKIESGRTARMILSGSQGKCRGVCAFVAYEDDRGSALHDETVDAQAEDA